LVKCRSVSLFHELNQIDERLGVSALLHAIGVSKALEKGLNKAVEKLIKGTLLFAPDLIDKYGIS
jgi:hypothetical protein